MQLVSMIDTIGEYALIVSIQERIGVEALVVVIMNFNSNGIDEYDEIMSALVG